MEEQFFDFYQPRLEEKTLANTVFTVMDFETTGLSPMEDRIIEVGLMKFTLDEEGEGMESFVDPERPLPRNIQKLCGITPGDIQNAPRMERLIPRILSFLEDTVPVAHNLNFDYGFLAAEANRAGYSYRLKWGIDTVSLAKEMLKGQRSYSLQALAGALQLPAGNSHRALDDAKLCRRIFLLCLDKIKEFREISVKNLFSLSKTRIKWRKYDY